MDSSTCVFMSMCSSLPSLGILKKAFHLMEFQLHYVGADSAVLDTWWCPFACWIRSLVSIAQYRIKGALQDLGEGRGGSSVGSQAPFLIEQKSN